MSRGDNRSDRGETPRQRRRRRITFRVWVIATIIAAIYVAAVGPLTYAYGREFWLAAMIVPPLMIFLLLGGLAWLAVQTNRPTDGTGTGTGTGEAPMQRDREPEPGSAAKSTASLRTPTPTSGTRR